MMRETFSLLCFLLTGISFHSFGTLVKWKIDFCVHITRRLLETKLFLTKACIHIQLPSTYEWFYISMIFHHPTLQVLGFYFRRKSDFEVKNIPQIS